MTVELIEDSGRLYVVAPYSAPFVAQVRAHGWETSAMRAPARRLALTRALWSFDARRAELVREMIAAGYPGAEILERASELAVA